AHRLGGAVRAEVLPRLTLAALAPDGRLSDRRLHALHHLLAMVDRRFHGAHCATAGGQGDARAVAVGRPGGARRGGRPAHAGARAISSRVFGKVRVNSRSPSTKPSGMSAMRPPTRVRLVVSRAPVHISWRS